MRKLGHEEASRYVGVSAHNGERVSLLITGTLDNAGLMYPMLGEATGKMSWPSMTEISDRLDDATKGDDANVDVDKGLISQILGGDGDEKTQRRSRRLLAWRTPLSSSAMLLMPVSKFPRMFAGSL